MYTAALTRRHGLVGPRKCFCRFDKCSRRVPKRGPQQFASPIGSFAKGTKESSTTYNKLQVL